MTTARSSTVLGVVVAAAFTVAVVGSNIPAPILPVYETHLGLSPFVLSAMFATYFVALVAMFLVSSRVPLGRFAWVVLPAALGVGVLGDIALWSGADSVGWLFVGRALTGTCVGLATGAAATLAVAARGDSGRTLAATGAIAGSAVGLVASATLAEVFPQPLVLIYRVHAATLVVTMVALVVVLWRHRDSAVGLRHDPPSVTGATRGDRLRDDLPAYGLGAAGWAVGGIAVGVLPTALRGGLGSDLLVVGVLAALILLVTAWLLPHAARMTARAPSAPVCLILIVVGCVLIAGGLVASMLWPVLIGSALWGIGQGFAYAAGLTMLTAGLTPVEQGRRTSLYACTSYGFAAVVIVVAGALSSAWGFAVGSASTIALFAAYCLGVLVLGRGRWERRNSRRAHSSSGCEGQTCRKNYALEVLR